jgi:predicted metal-dependent HD superfamily phosphohydrolase
LLSFYNNAATLQIDKPIHGAAGANMPDTLPSLSQEFAALIGKHTDDARLGERLWREIRDAYSARERCYHTLAHLEQMLFELRQVRRAIRDWDCLLFALYYHDLVYLPGNEKNEAQSAEIAVLRLGEIGFSPTGIEKIRRVILATRKHLLAEDEDTNFFMDADLSGLGQDREVYMEYSGRVRQEYAQIPTSIYNAGRIKMFRAFLAMPVIFKTRHFYDKFESQARQNLNEEIALLSAALP